MDRRHIAHYHRKNNDICTLDKFPRLRCKDFRAIFAGAKRMAALVNGSWVDTNTDSFNDLWHNYTGGTLTVRNRGRETKYYVRMEHNNNNKDLRPCAITLTWQYPGERPHEQRLNIVWHPSNLPNTAPYMYFYSQATGKRYRTLYQRAGGEWVPRPLITNGRYEIQRLTPRQKETFYMCKYCDTVNDIRRHWSYMGRLTPYGKRMCKLENRVDTIMYGEARRKLLFNS